MAKKHTVQQGECISSIAEQHGLFWKTLWTANSKLRETRTDPNRLAPGDVVEIADAQPKEESCAAEKRHRFKRNGVPAKLRLVMEENGIPLANKPYRLVVDGNLLEGKTDAKGLIDEWISPLAQAAELTIGELVYALELGGMNPIDDLVGIQSRLQNLGFYGGEVDGLMGPLTSAAITEFRALVQLPAGDKIDDAFRRELAAWADKEHEAKFSDASAGEVAEVKNAEHDLDLQKANASAGTNDHDDDRPLEAETGEEREA